MKSFSNVHILVAHSSPQGNQATHPEDVEAQACWCREGIDFGRVRIADIRSQAYLV